MLNIVIPTYRARDTLPAALDSLVAQTKKMFVVTISQDGDGEDYSDIIEEYERRGLHIRLICGINGGPGVARQRGFDCDRMCDYVMFLDSDDMLMPNAVDTLYTEAKRNNADVLASNFIVEHKHESNGLIDVMNSSVTWCHGKIYRADYLRSNKIRFREDIKLNEDAYFNLVAINCAKHSNKLEEVTYLWRDNKNSLTRESEYMGFFKKSWEFYVLSQVEALKEIVRINGDIKCTLLAATLINIYKHMMTAISEGIDTSRAKAYTLTLKEVPEIINTLDEYNFWVYIHQNLKASHYIEDKLIFFKQRFSDWVREYIKGE